MWLYKTTGYVNIEGRKRVMTLEQIDIEQNKLGLDGWEAYAVTTRTFGAEQGDHEVIYHMKKWIADD